MDGSDGASPPSDETDGVAPPTPTAPPSRDPADVERIGRLEAQVAEIQQGLDDLRRELGMTE